MFHRTASLAASAALAGGMLAIGAGTPAAGQPVTSQPILARQSATTADNLSAAVVVPNPILPGDVRVWELRRGHSAAAALGPLPGDVRVWELLHPWRP